MKTSWRTSIVERLGSFLRNFHVAPVFPLPHSPRQVISRAFGFDPDALFAEKDQGLVQLDGSLLHIQIYQQDEVNALLLVADLGPLPTENRSAYYHLMLVANSGWRDVAGGALCTNDEGDHGLLRLRLDLDTLDLDDLAQWITAFVVAAETWAQRIAPLPSATADLGTNNGTDTGFTQSEEIPGLSFFTRA